MDLQKKNAAVHQVHLNTEGDHHSLRPTHAQYGLENDCNLTYCNTSSVEGLVTKLLEQHGQHSRGVDFPPHQKVGGMCGVILEVTLEAFPFGVIRVAPWLGFPQEMDHLRIGTIPGPIRNGKTGSELR